MFFRCSFRPEVYSDVISGAIVDPTGVKVCVKHGDSRSNRSRDMRLRHFATNDDDYDNDDKRQRRCRLTDRMTIGQNAYVRFA